MKLKVEIIATNLASGAAALAGGADRIELVENLAEGGCTPSLGLMKQFKLQFPTLPLYVMIRPRGGDFVYNSAEIDQMYCDIEICKSLQVDGIVFGVLDKHGAVDTNINRQLLGFWGKPQATFHRAFDRCTDIKTGMKRVVELGFERVLTSGGKPTAIEGMDTIKQIQRLYGNEIIVMPGSGVTATNAYTIRTYCGIHEIHASCKTMSTSQVVDNGFADVFSYTDEMQVRELCAAFKRPR